MQGVDVSQPISIAAFKCLKQMGYNFAIVRAFRSIGKPDFNALQTIQNARDAMIDQVDAYMFPCPKCGNAQKQVDDMLNLRLGVNFVWVDIEIFRDHWYSEKTKNQAFFEELVNALSARKVNIGIYTNKNNWSSIMGDNYSKGAQFPLWYAHYDNKPNFDDFSPFGGWKYPTMKQYSGDQKVCGVGVDLNWKPLTF